MKLSAVIISVCMLCGLSAIVAYSWPSVPRKQAMEQQEAAKEFINYLVFDATGQKMFVEETALIPAAKNNPNQPLDPLGKDIAERTASGKLYTSCFIAPSDHWSVMGAAMQKYIAGMSDKKELASTLSQYWKAQN